MAIFTPLKNMSSPPPQKWLSRLKTKQRLFAVEILSHTAIYGMLIFSLILVVPLRLRNITKGFSVSWLYYEFDSMHFFIIFENKQKKEQYF